MLSRERRTNLRGVMPSRTHKPIDMTTNEKCKFLLLKVSAQPERSACLLFRDAKRKKKKDNENARELFSSGMWVLVQNKLCHRRIILVSLFKVFGEERSIVLSLLGKGGQRWCRHAFSQRFFATHFPVRLPGNF